MGACRCARHGAQEPALDLGIAEISPSGTCCVAKEPVVRPPFRQNNKHLACRLQGNCPLPASPWPGCSSAKTLGNLACMLQLWHKEQRHGQAATAQGGYQAPPSEGGKVTGTRRGGGTTAQETSRDGGGDGRRDSGGSRWPPVGGEAYKLTIRGVALFIPIV